MNDDLGPLWETLPPEQRRALILHAGGLAASYEEPLEGEDPDEMLSIFIRTGPMGGSEVHAAILRRLARSFIDGHRDPMEMIRQLIEEFPELSNNSS